MYPQDTPPSRPEKQHHARTSILQHSKHTLPDIQKDPRSTSIIGHRSFTKQSHILGRLEHQTPTMASGKFTEYPYVGEIHFGLIADRPIQLNYECCKACGKQGLDCIKPHRFFTFEGWLIILLVLFNSPPYTKHQVLQAAHDARNFFPGGFDAGEIGRCIVCRRTDCSRPHRKYTREGYAKYQIELMGIPREEAMERANEEFRVYGGDRAWYPQNLRGEFGPPKEYDPPAQVRAPAPPPEGWPQVNDDTYVNIMKTIRQAWKTESEGKSQPELLRLRDEFDQRWCNMSGEETPRYHMPWDDLPRPPAGTGDGSRGQYAGSGGGFVPPDAAHGGMPGVGMPRAQYGDGCPGHGGGQPQGAAQPGNPFAAYQNIPGMPYILFSGSGGGKGFTFHHHQGGQTQSYQSPSGCRSRRDRRRSYDEDQQPPQQHNPAPPPPRRPESTGKEAGANRGEQAMNEASEKPKKDPRDNPFNYSVQWYAKTFLEKTKEESVATTRVWAEQLCEQFVKEWGAWASTVEMPWDEDPSLKGSNRNGYGDDGARSPRDTTHGNKEGFKTSRATNGGLPVGDSFEERAKNWNRSQRRGSRDGYKPSHRTSDEEAFEERFKKSSRSERHWKDDRYRPSGRDRDAFEDKIQGMEETRSP